MPVAVAGGHAFTQITLGFEFACAIEVGGKLYCLGDNRDGELGDGTTGSRATMVRVKGIAP